MIPIGAVFWDMEYTCDVILCWQSEHGNMAEATECDCRVRVSVYRMNVESVHYPFGSRFCVPQPRRPPTEARIIRHLKTVTDGAIAHGDATDPIPPVPPGAGDQPTPTPDAPIPYYHIMIFNFAMNQHDDLDIVIRISFPDSHRLYEQQVAASVVFDTVPCSCHQLKRVSNNYDSCQPTHSPH